MFLRAFAQLERPFADTEQALLHAPDTWLPGLAERAERQGEELLAEVGFGNKVRVERPVMVSLQSPIRFEAKTVVPMTWRPVGGPALFPELDADIEVASLGPNRTQVSVTASYVPPFGLLGRTADRALMHRVAEMTLKDFVDRMVHALAHPLPATA